MNSRAMQYLKSISGGVVSPGEEAAAGEARGDRRHWTNTVFLQVADPEMEMALEELVNRAGCYSHTGEQGSPDIMAIPSFAIVVDRKVVGREQWEAFLQFRGEVNGMELCIIVDSLMDWPMPEEDFFMDRMPFRTPGDAQQVFEAIMGHRMAYLNR